jgi:hypothetical protein
MPGKSKRISLWRKIVIDFMHASVPLVVLKRNMQLSSLVSARATCQSRPSWAAIFAKGFSLVAREEPVLRCFYLKWPFPHFYEAPHSIATIAIARPDLGDGLIAAKIDGPDKLLIRHVDTFVQQAKTAPLSKLPSVGRMLLIARLPLPLRRFAWALALNVGRLRCNNFGTFMITSVGSLGAEQIVLRSPGPTLLSYGQLRDDHTIDVSMHWDHRIYDGVQGARVLHELENVLNTLIAEELRSAI